MKPGKFSLKERFRSFQYAFSGIRFLIKNEHNSRIHLLLGIIAIISGLIFNITRFEWILLIIVIGVVFISELFNSALEVLADFVNPEWNEKIRQVKDLSAAAVLFAAACSVLVGALMFIPYILDLLK